ncbi:head GIN domain-containing protein [Aequorivita sp. SDUM287046]|uniref:Head GIN domain-containing protein n=1 Tax=Aequorivita aurantiaca TaxID=3053356 RepID=A0ABT8DK84_9FLAO|nr:head GIN domain-containing protein [Aequorivita aurantiaca]MDN3725337.1 head GIN domain-containing protein [Aequorivita aurantiaca]
MRKTASIIVLLIAIFSFSGCYEEGIIGSGVTVTEIRQVDAFDKIASEGVFQVFFSQAEAQSVKIVADNNIMHRVKTEVVNGRLKLYMADGKYNKVNLQAHIKVRDLKEIENSGAGDMYIENIIRNGTFKSSNSGSGNIYLDGNCTFLDIKNEGSGNTLAFDMPAESCKINLEGSGDVEVTCISDLRINLEGSGNVYYKGYPSIHSNISGSGRVISKNN